MKWVSDSFSRTAVRLLSILLVVSLCAAPGACGRSKSRKPDTVPKAATVQAKHVSRSIDEIIAEVDAYQPPKGVDTVRFEKLREELRRQLLQKKSGKGVSKAPLGSVNAVTDLTAFSNSPYLQASVSWTEKLAGDYNNDGLVGIADLVPISTYYLQNVLAAPDDPHKLVNGDNNPEINLQDIPAIADHYDEQIAGYRVWRGHWNGTTIDWETSPPYRPNPNLNHPNWSADRPSPPPVSTRPLYTYSDNFDSPADESVRYKVMPTDSAVPPNLGPESGVASLVVETFTISGDVTLYGTGLPDVTVSLLTTDPVNPVQLQSATTDADGHYALTNVYGGGSNYVLSPWMQDYSFTPAMVNVTVDGLDLTQDFTARTDLYTVFGTVYDGNRPGPPPGRLGGVLITLTRQDGTTRTTLTMPSGMFTFGNTVPSGHYTAAATKAGYYFGFDALAAFYIDGNAVCTNFTGRGGLGGTPWPKFHGTMQNTGQTAFVGPQTNALNWDWVTLSPVASSPAIGIDGTLTGDGTVYVGGSTDPWYGGIVYALDPVYHTVRWTFSPGACVPCSPAVAADGTVYVASRTGYLYALNPANGSVNWSSSLAYGSESSPTIGLEGTIYIGDLGNTFYALNPLDGSVKWMVTLQTVPGASWGCAGFSEHGDIIYIADRGGYVYALNAETGQQEWRQQYGTDTRASVVVGTGGTLYVACESQYAFYALNPADGSVKWGPIGILCGYGSPAVGVDGTIYLGSPDGNLYALSPADGSVKWSYATGSLIGSSPAVGAPPPPGQNGVVYFGTYAGDVYAVDAVTGALNWRYVHRAGQGGVLSSPAIGAHGYLYIGALGPGPPYLIGHVYQIGP